MLGGGAKYQELHHATTGHTLHRLRTKGYQLPTEVANAVDLVAPATHVPTMRPTKPTCKKQNTTLFLEQYLQSR